MRQLIRLKPLHRLNQQRGPTDMRAAIWRRVLATSIDFVVVPGMAMLVMLVTGVIENAEAWVDGFPWIRVFLLGVVGYLLVNGMLLFRSGQTLGKWLLKIRIVDYRSGETAPFWKLLAFRAPFFPLLHGALIGYWYLLLLDAVFALRADRRCLHDILCGTKVISINNLNTGE